MFEQNITFSYLKKKLRWLHPYFLILLLWKLTKGKAHSTCAESIPASFVLQSNVLTSYYKK